MKINGTSKSLALGGLIGTTVAIMYVVNAEDLDGDGFHEFVPGTGISSSQMNYNFDQVTLDFNNVNQGLDEIDERLGLFEGTIAIDGANIGISGSISAADFYGDGSSLTDLDATSLTTGTVATTRLGIGTADSSTFLRGDGAWAPVSGVAGSGTANYLPLFTNGSTIGNSAIYQSNGNVGIGTTAPGSKLAVAGSATIGSSYSTIVAPSNGMVIEGNVGIGTTSPGSALAVKGYVQLDLSSGAPPSGDCDEESELGRMKVDPDDGLYVCLSGGWALK